MGGPRLSVVMPLHEGEAYLDAALASLPDDPTGLIEVIALDSGVEPLCLSIIGRHAGRLTLRYEHLPHMVSWTEKTNCAVAMARAPHVAMLHQDDLWLPGRLETILAALDKGSEAALILTAANIVDEQGRNLGVWRCPLDGSANWSSAAVVERLLVQNFVALPSVVIPKQLWLRIGGLDETLWYTPDWDLYMKAALLGNVHYIAEPTVAFRIHSGSQTMQGSRSHADFLAQMEIVVTRYADAVGGRRAPAVRRIAAASARINALLAQAVHGQKAALAGALLELLRLGPYNIPRYFRDSRIVERVLPRLRARLRGAA